MRQRSAKGDAGSDIDQMLTEFFRADLPNPWPAPPGMSAGDVSPSASLASPRRGERMPGKWALAVSMATLALIGAWLFRLSPTPPREGMSLDNGTANVPAHLQPKK